MPRAELEQLLFSEVANVYAILDGASVKDLPQILFEKAPPHFCLFRGNLEPDVAAVAPYVVGLVRGSLFTDWMLDAEIGAHYGIFAASRQSIHEMRRHFRGLFTVYKENGDPMYFRFYDPRVLRAFLPTCNGGELKTFFGPVDRIIAENEDGTAYSTFRLKGNEVAESITELKKGD